MNEEAKEDSGFAQAPSPTSTSPAPAPSLSTRRNGTQGLASRLAKCSECQEERSQDRLFKGKCFNCAFKKTDPKTKQANPGDNLVSKSTNAATVVIKETVPSSQAAKPALPPRSDLVTRSLFPSSAGGTLARTTGPATPKVSEEQPTQKQQTTMQQKHGSKEQQGKREITVKGKQKQKESSFSQNAVQQLKLGEGAASSQYRSSGLGVSQRMTFNQTSLQNKPKESPPQTTDHQASSTLTQARPIVSTNPRSTAPYSQRVKQEQKTENNQLKKTDQVTTKQDGQAQQRAPPRPKQLNKSRGPFQKLVLEKSLQKSFVKAELKEKQAKNQLQKMPLYTPTGSSYTSNMTPQAHTLPSHTTPSYSTPAPAYPPTSHAATLPTYSQNPAPVYPPSIPSQNLPPPSYSSNSPLYGQSQPSYTPPQLSYAPPQSNFPSALTNSKIIDKQPERQEQAQPPPHFTPYKRAQTTHQKRPQLTPREVSRIMYQNGLASSLLLAAPVPLPPPQTPYTYQSLVYTPNKPDPRPPQYPPQMSQRQPLPSQLQQKHKPEYRIPSGQLEQRTPRQHQVTYHSPPSPPAFQPSPLDHRHHEEPKKGQRGSPQYRQKQGTPYNRGQTIRPHTFEGEYYQPASSSVERFPNMTPRKNFQWLRESKNNSRNQFPQESVYYGLPRRSTQSPIYERQGQSGSYQNFRDVRPRSPSYGLDGFRRYQSKERSRGMRWGDEGWRGLGQRHHAMSSKSRGRMGYFRDY